jgi:ubiquinone/menaquinone biosynthesis C-methylase UbiE
MHSFILGKEGAMAAMVYDDAAAELLEKAYLGPDVVGQRADTLQRLNIAKGESVLDIGSGPGFLAEAIAEQTREIGQVIGVDISAQMIRRATARAKQSWLRYEVADATNLPFADASFDVVVSTQVAEYVPDIDSFCAEVARVLKPNGRGIILATDWGAVCWHSSDPERMDRVLQAFAPHCADSRLPRTLAPRLRKAGLSIVEVSYFPIINLDRYEGCYSEAIVPFFKAYIKDTGKIADAELDAWEADLADLNARGAHFFSTGRFSFAFDKT